VIGPLDHRSMPNKDCFSSMASSMKEREQLGGKLHQCGVLKTDEVYSAFYKKESIEILHIVLPLEHIRRGCRVNGRYLFGAR
jgi:hypothetical protein